HRHGTRPAAVVIDRHIALPRIDWNRMEPNRLAMVRLGTRAIARTRIRGAPREVREREQRTVRLRVAVESDQRRANRGLLDGPQGIIEAAAFELLRGRLSCGRGLR